MRRYAAEERCANFAFLVSIDQRVKRITMNAVTLIKRNLTHYWRTNLAVILGVATAVAVLSGALLVGDSVRGTLRDLVLQRLGKTDQVITSSSFFRVQLADDIRGSQDFSTAFSGIAPMIAVRGFVTAQVKGT